MCLCAPKALVKGRGSDFNLVSLSWIMVLVSEQKGKKESPSPQQFCDSNP